MSAEEFPDKTLSELSEEEKEGYATREDIEDEMVIVLRCFAMVYAAGEMMVRDQFTVREYIETVEVAQELAEEHGVADYL